MEGLNDSTLNEPAPEGWGGPWTDQKLSAFASYVRSYLTIMKKNPYWKTIYFDGFAGSGTSMKRSISKRQYELNFFEDGISVDEIDVYKGSVQRVLENPLTFDSYYFVDTDPENIASIEALKKTITHIAQDKINVKNDDCNNQLFEVSKLLKTKKYAALLFIDPFGMQVNWESIECLKDTRTDIWILIPSGISINRLLPRKEEVRNKQKLEKFFGMDYKKLHSFFYEDKEVLTLFEETKVTEKRNNPIGRIVDLYKQQLKTIWQNVSDKPLILKNSKNVPIFHFLFASNNSNAMKIASQIIQKKQS